MPSAGCRNQSSSVKPSNKLEVYARSEFNLLNRQLQLASVHCHFGLSVINSELYFCRN